MSDSENFTPRHYQVELMKIALAENTIIYLPTGSGKTFIAVLVLKAMSGALTRPYSAGGKISVILVNTVALVPQHQTYIIDHSLLKAGCYTGELRTDFWTKEEWEGEFNKYQVLIMTSQILLNILNSNFIDLKKVNLVIFDECHRGVEEQPMRQIMKHFRYVDDEPRVIGLTATLLNGNCKLHKVMDEVRSLETTYKSKVATVDGLQHVVGHSTNPREELMICNQPVCCNIMESGVEHLEALKTLLRAVVLESSDNGHLEVVENLKPLETEDVLKRLKNLIQDLLEHIKMLGIFGGHKACIAYMIQVERIRKHCQDKKMFIILNYVMTVFGCVLELFRSHMSKFNDLDKLYKFSSDKVLKLFKILENYESMSNEELCAIIFVQRRFTAKIIHHILEAYKQCNPDMNYIKSNFIVGNSNNPYNDSRENLFIAKKNKEVLDSFMNKEINVLVSSNVLEEGVDIPKCTLVVKFDKSEDYRSYIQSKGRARHKSSIYYTIVEINQLSKFQSKLTEFRKIETLLTNFLVGKTSDRFAPSQDEVDQMYNEDEIEPYYVDGLNSAQVNMSSAVSLLSRYCSTLPCDIYTTYTPDWYCEYKPNSPLLRVVIILPIICPIVDPIKGPYMHCKKNAKRAAALYACIALHKCGELDNNLLPAKRPISEEDFSHLFSHYPEIKENSAGNKKMKRLHYKQIPEYVNENLCADIELYLHVIKINPTYTLGEDYNLRAIYDLYQDPLSFGFLTTKPLPEIIKFPLYDSQGELEIVIKVNAKTVTLTHNQMMELRRFHFMIFNDLLEVLKPFLVFSNNENNSDVMLIVPIQDDDNLEIDFSVVAQHKTLKDKLKEPTSSEKSNLTVTEEDYLHKIVSPWYRPQPSMYIVTRVFIDKCPLSSFPNQDYVNFASYYQEKHYLNIVNLKQPLLLVKGLSKKLNLYKPSGIERKRKKEKRYEEVEEYLIPELVVKQDFPSSLWIKARILPSVLSRVSFLLKLRQLQERIALDLNLNLDYLLNLCPLQLDINLLNYVPYEIPKITETPPPADPNVLALESSSIVPNYYNKDFAIRKLEAEYPWRKIDEPKDIERDMTVTVMDIEHYEVFISHSPNKDERLCKNESPSRSKALPAITYPEEFLEKEIGLLKIDFRGQSPTVCELYKALTAAEANDIVNLERLETLGDSFLKYIVSLYIIFKYPLFNEGKSTALKGRLVSNKNLFYLGRIKNLGGILRNSAFSPGEDWTPPCFTVPDVLETGISNMEYSVNSLFYFNIPMEEQISGNLTQTTVAGLNSKAKPIAEDEENSCSAMCNFLNKQYISDKTVADTVEALLGAYYQSGGFEGAVKFVEWMGVIPQSENLKELLSQRVPDPLLDKHATAENIDFHIPQWEEFERRLGYHFKNRAFLLQALTHSSYLPNRLTRCYERLEFLGDAILDFLITSYIYEHCGNLNPGQITDLRSALVNNNTFASLVVRNGFHKFFLMINSKLQDHIDKFAKYLECKNYIIDDEVLILLEEQDMNIAEYIDVPKVLGDIFEALAGAVYLDSGKDILTVWRVFYKLMWKEIDLFSKNVPINILRRLYECPGLYPSFSKAFETESNKTMIALEFLCEGRKKRVYGFGTNKNMAKRAAAKIALRSLRISAY